MFFLKLVRNLFFLHLVSVAFSCQINAAALEELDSWAVGQRIKFSEPQFRVWLDLSELIVFHVKVDGKF